MNRTHWGETYPANLSAADEYEDVKYGPLAGTLSVSHMRDCAAANIGTCAYSDKITPLNQPRVIAWMLLGYQFKLRGLGGGDYIVNLNLSQSLSNS